MRRASRRPSRATLVRAAVLACVSVVAHAQQKPADYPTKPVRILVGVFPGGGLDILSRSAAQMLTAQWGQTVIVDDRPGGGQIIAMDLAAQAAPDGYTLFGASSAILLVGVMKRVPFDIRKAYDPVIRMSSQMFMLLVTPSLPVKSVAELIAYAKGKPGTLAYGSAGVGTTPHIGMEKLNAMAGIKIVHVPYKVSDQAMLDIVAGQIQLIMTNPLSGTSFAKSGKLRLLAVTGAKRMRSFPEVPTVAEAVPGYELANTYDLYAPAGTPRPIVAALNKVIGDGMRAPAMVQRLAADGAEPGEPMTPDELKAKIAREYADWQQQAQRLNLQLF